MALLVGLVAPVSMSGCSGGDESEEVAVGPCEAADLAEARRALIDAVGLPARRPPPPKVERGDTRQGQGFSMTAVRWAHGEVEGDFAHGLWLEPEPPRAGPLPLLVNVHGHWEAGVEADEVLYRSQLFARQGWAVLSVASRGREQGDAAVPGWRAAHFADGLYGELRGRRAGRTPLGWNVVAAWGGIDAALAGRFSDAVIERDALAVMGFSGGAEQAVVVATTDPRVDGAVIGSYEYGFGSDDGNAACSCGALAGGHEPERRALWLATAACRPGAPPVPRATLAWDGQPHLEQSDRLARLGAEVRPTGGFHGINHPMAAHSWGFLEARLLGAVVTPAQEDAARVGAREAWLPVDPSLRIPWGEGQPGPGLREQGPPPWRGPGTMRAEVVRPLLGLVGDVDPGEGWPALGDHLLELHPPRGRSDGRGWVVVAAKTPARNAAEPERYDDPEVLGMVPAAVRHLDPDASFAVLWPRTSGGSALDQRLSRQAIERGQAPLGIAVADALGAADRLAARPDTEPDRVGFIGLGAGAPAAMWAAALRGGEAPVVVIDGPVTLWWDGPRQGEQAPLRPWPGWLLAPIPQGVSLDPWLAAGALGDRLRWVAPRGGDGLPWQGRAPPGRILDDPRQALIPE